MNAPRDPKKRFSDRVAHYVRYRPSYPAAILPFLAEKTGFDAATVVADIGSGTGLLARVFLEHGNSVYGVEPNEEMRQAGEALLASFPRFTSVSGSAEATNLEASSVDLISAGQSFHWFDPEGARTEFRRILRPGGWAVLIWNARRQDGSTFMAGYEAMLRRFGTDYLQVRNRGEEEADLRRFFAPGEIQRGVFENQQVFDRTGLEGRLLSSSYVPLSGQPGHREMMAELERLFLQHQGSGRVTFL